MLQQKILKKCKLCFQKKFPCAGDGDTGDWGEFFHAYLKFSPIDHRIVDKSGGHA